MPGEESGVRRVDKKEQEKRKADKEHEEVLKKMAWNPDDPWAQHGPEVEKDTAKVWGVTKEEDRAMREEDEAFERKLKARKKWEAEWEKNHGKQQEDIGSKDTELDQDKRKKRGNG